MTLVLSSLDCRESTRIAFHCQNGECYGYESVLTVRDANDPDPVYERGTPDKQRRKPQPTSA
jgi:hypothetical protein